MHRTGKGLQNQILCAVGQHGHEHKHGKGPRSRIGPGLLKCLLEVLFLQMFSGLVLHLPQMGFGIFLSLLIGAIVAENQDKEQTGEAISPELVEQLAAFLLEQEHKKEKRS